MLYWGKTLVDIQQDPIPPIPISTNCALHTTAMQLSTHKIDAFRKRHKADGIVDI